MIKFDFSGLLDLRNIAEQIRSASGSLRPLFENKGEELKEAIAEASTKRVESQQGYPPLNASYEARKRRLVGSRPILVFSGEMLEGLRDGRAFDLDLVNSQEISVTITDPKAKFHQQGAGSLPQRPVLEPTAELSNTIAKLYKESLEEDLKKRFKK